MKKRTLKAAVSIILSIVMFSTCCISSYAVKTEWETRYIPQDSHWYRGQCEFEEYPNIACSVVRAESLGPYTADPYYMFVEPYIRDNITQQVVASNGTYYNNIVTHSISWYASKNSPGTYEIRGFAGYYEYTDSDGDRNYKTVMLDDGIHVILPSKSSSNLDYTNTLSKSEYKTTGEGKTYGDIATATSIEDVPDLISARGDNGTNGYVLSEDFFYRPSTLEEIEEYMEAVNSGETMSIPVYDLNGNMIDSFTFSNDGFEMSEK